MASLRWDGQQQHQHNNEPGNYDASRYGFYVEPLHQNESGQAEDAGALDVVAWAKAIDRASSCQLLGSLRKAPVLRHKLRDKLQTFVRAETERVKQEGDARRRHSITARHLRVWLMSALTYAYSFFIDSLGLLKQLLKAEREETTPDGTGFVGCDRDRHWTRRRPPTPLFHGDDVLQEEEEVDAADLYLMAKGLKYWVTYDNWLLRYRHKQRLRAHRFGVIDRMYDEACDQRRQASALAFKKWLELKPPPKSQLLPPPPSDPKVPAYMIRHKPPVPRLSRGQDRVRHPHQKALMARPHGGGSSRDVPRIKSGHTEGDEDSIQVEQLFEAEEEVDDDEFAEREERRLRVAVLKEWMLLKRQQARLKQEGDDQRRKQQEEVRRLEHTTKWKKRDVVCSYATRALYNM